MQVLVLKACRLYNTFGSGAIHGIYAQFMAQSAIHNKGRQIGLLRGATTRFATWFYAMMRLLRMKDVLLSTVHSAAFKDVEKTDVVRAAIFDITDPKFFKALYILLRAVFPAIRVLRYCDIGQVSAYTRKLHELPLGTSKGLLHFVQYKGSTKVIRY